MPNASKESVNAKARETEVRPIRMKPRNAAKYIGVGYERMLDMINGGVFTSFDNGLKGVMRRLHVLVDELDIYATEGPEALRRFRVKKKRVKKAGA